jgi:hypothetical protein
MDIEPLESFGNPYKVTSSSLFVWTFAYDMAVEGFDTYKHIGMLPSRFAQPPPGKQGNGIR